MTIEEPKIEIPIPTPDNVHNIIEHPNEAIPHVVEHEGKIAHLEEQQAMHVAQLNEQIDKIRGEIFTAIQQSKDEQASTLETRLASLEGKLDTLTAPVIETPKDVLEEIGEAPGEAIELVPEVQKTVEPKLPRGLRARRKAKHGKS